MCFYFWKTVEICQICMQNISKWLWLCHKTNLWYKRVYFFCIAIEIWILEKDNRNDEQKTHLTKKIEWINIEQSVWWFNIAHFKVGLFIFFCSLFILSIFDMTLSALNDIIQRHICISNVWCIYANKKRNYFEHQK